MNTWLRQDCEKQCELFITPTTWNAESGAVEGKGNTGRMKWRRHCLLNKEFSVYLSIERDFTIIKITGAETIKMCHFIELGLKWDGSDNCCMFFKMIIYILMCTESIAMKIDTYLVVLDDR